jgi:thioredoxin 1
VNAPPPRTVYIIASARIIDYYKENKQMGNEPLHLTDANFDETVKNNKVALIDFWAGWCGPCRALAPIIEELARDYSGKVLVGKLDVDENPKTAECFQVFSIPTIIVFKDGCEVDRLVGLCAKNRIEDTLKKHI